MENIIISGGSNKPNKNKFEKTGIYESDGDIPESVKGAHLEKMEEYRIKIKSYDSSNSDEYLRFSIGEGAGKELVNAELVSYFDTKEVVERCGMKGGYPNYVISGVDEKSKRSDSYRNCTCVIVVGEDAETGKQISFITHQNPSYAFAAAEGDFRRDLGDTIDDFSKRVKAGTSDVTILGGNYYETINNENEGAHRVFTNAEQYADTLPKLAQLVKSCFAKNEIPVSPVILSGPDMSDSVSKFSETDIVLDTQARLVITARQKQFYEISSEIHDASDTPAILEALNENKVRVNKPFLMHPSDELFESANEKARRHIDGQDPDFVPQGEREVFDTLNFLGLPVFESFNRRDKKDINQMYIDPRDEHKGMKLIYGADASDLMKTKIDAVPNIHEFLGRAVHDMLQMSVASMHIVSPQKSFLYYYDPKTGDISYVLGGTGGYMHIQKKAESREDALVQNLSSFMKSFHTFIDFYVKPEAIPEYMELLSNKLKLVLKKNLKEERYQSIVETF